MSKTHSQEHHHSDEISDSHNATRSIVLVLALSLHHIFEGLSIGLQKSFSNVWHVTLAVLCHETAICFSLGLQFFKTDRKLTKKVAVILIISATIMPLGILIGAAIVEIGDHSSFSTWQDLVNGILQALACGTFIYVTFFEIFYEQLGHGKTTFCKILLVIVGFAFIALIGLLPEEVENVGNPTNGTGT
ncbi:hypothetical protein HELRODRAFT_72339 [Helobdella robusta]|uniref:Zinc/iron permease n=1 Tax=Helobdella robusta TaxID=6412 RepID=T1G0Y6_HELRO|nr:hypothetical protein HELRODRAFT_72339 [Helobdella robusta]ESO10655.1 hypothetical protein HELRODRAFT_72339 [Helobdella robusta]